MAGAISAAIQGAGGLGMTGSQVRVVNTASTGVSGMGGYIQMTSGLIGNSGRIGFSSDQTVLDNLGFSISREASDNLVQMKAVAGNGNITTVETSDGRGVGLLDGIDVKFISQTAQIGGATGLEEGMKITSTFNFSISSIGGVAGKIGTYTVTAGYWTMEGIARSINRQILVSAQYTTLVAGVVDGELQLSYTAASAGLTSGFNIVGNTMLSGELGITDGPKSGSTTGAKNVDRVSWGFSAYLATNPTHNVYYSVSDGVKATSLKLYATITAATTPDMITFETLKTSVNSRLVAASVAVRIDQSGSTFAFTSKNIGTVTQNNGTQINSFIDLNIVISGAGSLSAALAKFQIDPGSANGSGDANFRLHVINKQPRFQIGANSGEINESEHRESVFRIPWSGHPGSDQCKWGYQGLGHSLQSNRPGYRRTI